MLPPADVSPFHHKLGEGPHEEWPPSGAGILDSLQAPSDSDGLDVPEAATVVPSWQPQELDGPVPASLADFFQRAAKDLCLHLPHSPCHSGACIPAFRPNPDLSASQALMQLPQPPPDGLRTCSPACTQPELMPKAPGLAHAPRQHYQPCLLSADARTEAEPSAAAHPSPAQQDAHDQQQQQQGPSKPSAGPRSPPFQPTLRMPDLHAPGCQKQAPCSDFSSLLAHWHPPAACITTGAPSLRLPAAATAARSPSEPSTPAERSQAGSDLLSPPATPAGRAQPQGSPLAVRGGGRRKTTLSQITLEQLEKEGLFDLPIQEAAEQLGVGLSVLKRVCRQKGLARWPFRTRQSLRGVISRTEEYYQGDAEEASTPKAEVVGALQDNLHALLGVEGQGLTHSVRKYRQSVFKLNYKLKRQDAHKGGCKISATAAAKVAK